MLPRVVGRTYDVDMATWEDGPEYAPLEHPDGFSNPDVAPLEVAAPQGSLRTGAPTAQPSFQPSADPGPPLAGLAPQRTDDRDPTQPFDVVESAVTADTSAWSGAHSSSITQPPGGWGAPAGGPVVASAPAAAAVREASTPFQLSGGGPQHPPPTASFPQSGSVQWFAPPTTQQQPAAGPPLTVFQALTPGYVVVLAMSVIWVIAPATLIIGAILAGQVKAAEPVIGRVRIGALVLFGLVALLAIPLGDGTFSGWWGVISIWAMLIALFLLAASVVLVQIDRTRTGGYQPPGQNWG